MRAAATGAVEPVGLLYDRYAAILLPIARRIAGSREEAEDVLHDLFVSLPERAKSYTTARGRVGAWLIIVVRNLALDRVRRRDRRTALQHENSEPPPTPRSPESGADLSLRAPALHATVAGLPAVQREVLELAFFEGLAYGEIAERLKIPLGTVKTRVARAIAKLRDVIRDDG